MESQRSYEQPPDVLGASLLGITSSRKIHECSEDFREGLHAPEGKDESDWQEPGEMLVQMVMAL
jgi:hypothetical protein